MYMFPCTVYLLSPLEKTNKQTHTHTQSLMLIIGPRFLRSIPMVNSHTLNIELLHPEPEGGTDHRTQINGRTKHA